MPGFEFDKITEAGKELVSVTGPDKIGLENMGNSCYLNSVLQVMKLVPLLRENYGEQVSGDIFKSLPSSSDPTTDFSTQMSKVITALTTDRCGAIPITAFRLRDCPYSYQKGAFPRTVTLTVYSYQSLIHIVRPTDTFLLFVPGTSRHPTTSTTLPKPPSRLACSSAWSVKTTPSSRRGASKMRWSTSR